MPIYRSVESQRRQLRGQPGANLAGEDRARNMAVLLLGACRGRSFVLFPPLYTEL